LIGNSDFYQEYVFHIAMTNTDQILYWFNSNYVNYPKVYNDTLLLEEILEEMNYVIGYEGRSDEILVSNLSDWDGDFVYTGIKIDGRNVWRFTPKNMSEIEVLNPGNVEGTSSVVFGLEKINVTFPEAVIFETGMVFSQSGPPRRQNRSRPGA
jgi:hypothetical protein